MIGCRLDNDPNPSLGKGHRIKYEVSKQMGIIDILYQCDNIQRRLIELTPERVN